MRRPRASVLFMVARDKEDLSGQQIGNYEIESHIAARNASDLFLARDVKLERLVFLEVLRVTDEEDDDLAARFRRRMETVSQLKDPHVAVVSDLDVTDDGFPALEIGVLGYAVETFGQKTYNGVAVLSRRPIEVLSRSLPGLDGLPDDGDGQARYLEALTQGCLLYTSPSPRD